MSTRWTEEDIKKKGLQISGGILSNFISDKKAAPSNQHALFALGRMKAGNMNKTEAAYAKYLELQKRFGDVAWYAFEPMNLRLGIKCFYNIDFLVMLKNGQLECHEVKGGFITDDALVKVKAAAEKYPFRFIIVQLKKGEWIIREF